MLLLKTFMEFDVLFALCDFNSETEHRSCPHQSQNVEVVKGEGYFWGGCNSDPVCLCRCPKTALAKPVFQ